MHTRHVLCRLLVGAALCAPQLVAAQRVAAPTAGTVLFVCEHGTVKSLLAKMLFERYAAQVGLPWRAVSRGTAVDSMIPPWMVQSLAADQFTLGTWKPQALQAVDVASATYVVSFDVPSSVTAAAKTHRALWDSLPSVSQSYASGRDAINTRVRHLVDSLHRTRP